MQSMLHWAMAPALTGSILCVLKAQQYDWKTSPEPKGIWMYRHKSLGLLTAIIAVPRIMTKLSAPAVAAVSGPAGIQMAARLSHSALYGFMGVMAVTGVAMGIFSGKGLPFFVTTLAEGGPKIDAVSGTSYKVHTFIGHNFKYIVPLHIGAAGYHAGMGHKVFARINPFGG